MSERPVLFIVTDASATWGMGHVIRCLALAEAWRRIGRPVFCLSQSFTPAERRIYKSRYKTVQARGASRIEAAKAEGAAAVVVDLPKGGRALSRRMTEAGFDVIHIDDSGPIETDPSPLVLNPNLYASQETNGRRAKERTLIGPRYALLRSEFPSRRRERSHSDKDLHALVVFGGTDAGGLTPLALRAASKVDAIDRISVICNEHAASYNETRALTRKIGRAELFCEVSSIAELMVQADLAIGAAGTTVMELACLGTPQAITPVVPSQEMNAQAWENAGAVHCFGSMAGLSEMSMRNEIQSLVGDVERRKSMSEAGQNIIDGKGAQRVAESISSLASGAAAK